MGSLFKLRDFWTTRYVDEEFDARSFTVGNLDNDPSPTALSKVALGSFQGNFRLIAPKQKGILPEDTLFEVNIGTPILQVASGNVSSSSVRSIVLLTPKKLIVGNFVRHSNAAASDGAAIDPLQRLVSWRPEAEIPLDHTPYNMVVGSFGGGRGVGAYTQDQICVQSMDGQMAFFDSRKLLFARFLPSKTFMCPGTLMYMPKADAIFTCSSTFELECYRILNLASSTASETKEQAQGRKLSPDWSMVLGEDAVDMIPCRHSTDLQPNQVEIMVLTPHTLLCLKEDGTLRWNKRIEGIASCMTAYVVSKAQQQHNLIVGTHSQQLLIVAATGVIWNAKCNAVPLCIAVSNYANVNGMIAFLGDDGTFSINYLGTDPANNPIPALDSKEPDYAAMDDEHRRLQLIVRQATNGVKQEPRDTLRLAVSQAAPVFVGGGGRRMTRVTLRLEYTGPHDLQNIGITVSSTLPVRCDPGMLHVPHLGRGDVFDAALNFYFAADAQENDRLLTPSSLLADVVACYVNPSPVATPGGGSSAGEPLTARQAILLPLTLVGFPTGPARNPQPCLIQLDTNKGTCNLAQLFDELAAMSPDVSANLVSFQYMNGVEVSVIGSKNAGKYRIQSTHFDGLWLLTTELVRRLRGYHRKEGGEEFLVDFTDALPVPQYFETIDAHFEARKQLAGAHERLANRAQQFRAVQKRLLVRFRERNAAPLASLNLLFEETYRQVLEGCEITDAALSRLEQSSAALACATHLMLLLIRAKNHTTMTMEDFDALRHYLSPVVQPATATAMPAAAINNTTDGPAAAPIPSCGWEETTLANMTHLLRTTLSKSGKEQAMTALPPLIMPSDTIKLKKSINTVLDRICRGGSVVESLTSKRRQIVEARGPTDDQDD